MHLPFGGSAAEPRRPSPAASVPSEHLWARVGLRDMTGTWCFLLKVVRLKEQPRCFSFLEPDLVIHFWGIWTCINISIFLFGMLKILITKKNINIKQFRTITLDICLYCKCLHICVQIHVFHQHFYRCFFEATNWAVNFTAPGRLFEHNMIVNNMDASGKTCDKEGALYGIECTQYRRHYAHCSIRQ